MHYSQIENWQVLNDYDEEEYDEEHQEEEDNYEQTFFE